MACGCVFDVFNAISNFRGGPSRAEAHTWKETAIAHISSSESTTTTRDLITYSGSLGMYSSEAHAVSEGCPVAGSAMEHAGIVGHCSSEVQGLPQGCCAAESIAEYTASVDPMDRVQEMAEAAHRVLGGCPAAGSAMEHTGGAGRCGSEIHVVPQGCCAAGSVAEYSASVGPMDRAQEMAEVRVGRLPVEGRYYKLPHCLKDHYELPGGEKLGQGYSGSVVLARSRRTGAAYAVKSFKFVGEHAFDHDRLTRELGMYLTMDHPHIARLIAVYESETEISMVMECCEGGELLGRLRRKKVFTEEEAAQVTWQMLLAINYLHSEGVVHRDLKLENFIFEQENGHFLKLIDFGFSEFFPKSAVMKESMGTLHYVAPEVLEQSYSGGSCDMWSLGVIVFSLLAGRLPFGHRQSDVATHRAILRGRFVMQAAQWSHISATGRDFVKRLLVRGPCDRMTAEEAMRHPWLARYSGMGQSVLGGGLTSTPQTLATSEVAEAFLSFSRASRFQQACMQMMAWVLPAKERRLLRGTFLKMDTARKGVFRLPQIDWLLEENSVSKSDREAVRRALAVLDIDQDGDFHYSDFLAVMMARRLTERYCDVVEEVFWSLDVEGRGYLTEEGLWQMLGEEVSRSDLKHAFSALDVDRHNKIRLTDFVDYLCEELADASKPV